MKPSKLLSSLGLLSAGFILSTSNASAIAVYDNGPFTNTSSSSDLSQNVTFAEDFSLTATSTTIRSIHWQGRLASTNPAKTYEIDDFRVQIYQDASPISPSGLLYDFHVGSNVNRTDTGIDFFGLDMYTYSANLGGSTGITLGAGTYWLSIFNDSSADSDGDWWTWSYGVADTTPAQVSYNATSTWAASGGINSFGFVLDSDPVQQAPTTPTNPTNPTTPTTPTTPTPPSTPTVSEPGILGLVGIGMLGLVGTSRRRKTLEA